MAHRFDCECPSGGPCAPETGTLLTRSICDPLISVAAKIGGPRQCQVYSSATIIVVELRCLVKSFDQCHPNAKLLVMSGVPSTSEMDTPTDAVARRGS